VILKLIKRLTINMTLTDKVFCALKTLSLRMKDLTLLLLLKYTVSKKKVSQDVFVISSTKLGLL